MQLQGVLGKTLHDINGAHMGSIVCQGILHQVICAPDCWFSHLAVEVPGEGTSNEWCEPVPEETYKELQ